MLKKKTISRNTRTGLIFILFSTVAYFTLQIKGDMWETLEFESLTTLRPQAGEIIRVPSALARSTHIVNDIFGPFSSSLFAVGVAFLAVVTSDKQIKELRAEIEKLKNGNTGG